MKMHIQLPLPKVKILTPTIIIRMLFVISFRKYTSYDKKDIIFFSITLSAVVRISLFQMCKNPAKYIEYKTEQGT